MTARELTRSVWEIDAEEFPANASVTEQARFLLRYAILAPSSHNSQPWRFRVTGPAIEIEADESRWLTAADPDKRELFISVGCAVENLCVAAEHFGFDPHVDYQQSAEGSTGVTVELTSDATPSRPRPPDLFDAITQRYTSHELFDDRPLESDLRSDWQSLHFEDEVALHVVKDPETKAALGELQAEADRLQMDDPAYRKELGHWIGLGALGSSWLFARIGQAVVSHFDIGDREAAKNSKLIESAPVIAVLTTGSDDPAAQIRTGQAFERLALHATAAGIAVHPMSQALERPEIRTQLAALLGTSDAPQQLCRIGYADEDVAHTPRWPLETVLVEE